MHPLKAMVLTLGLGLFLALTALAARALYQAPRLAGAFLWQANSWTASQDAPPLKAGDRLVVLGGRTVGFQTLLVDNMHIGSKAELQAWFQEKAILYSRLQGATVSASVVRGSETLGLELPLEQGGWAFLSNPALVHWPVALVFFLVGWATYLRPGAQSSALWFYLMCLSMSLVYLTNATSLMAAPVLEPWVFEAMNGLNTANFVLAPALLFHFSLLLPRSRPSLVLWSLLTPAYLAAAWVIVTVSIPGAGILVPLLFLGSLLAIAQGAWSYRTAIERQQMKWVGVGFLLGLGPWLVINGLPLLVTGQRLMSDTLPGACLVFIPIFMAVAIERYRLFDVGAFLEGTLVYLGSVALLILCELALLGALAPSLPVKEPHLVSLALLLGLYGPVRARVSHLMARLFHRTQPASQEALQLLRRKVTGMGVEGIAEGLEETVRTLWAPQNLERVRAEEGCQVGARLEMNDPPTALLVVAPDLALRCGPLPSGRYYSSRTMRDLQLLTEQAALYHQAAVYYGQADQERRRRLEERESLLGDLHDGVGSALAGIRLVSSESKVTAMAADALFELQNFLYDSADYTVQRDHFVAELRGYTRRLFEDGPTELTFEAAGADQGTIGRSAALSVFRLIREALNNALKHSQASKVCLRLEFGQDLHLVLQDNGQGLQGHSGQGRGLTGMAKRMDDLGGRLDISSPESGGVRIEARLPL
jgi:signal transduction histidine kinase